MSSLAEVAIAKTDFELVKHPAYSSDSAPSDYVLLPKLKEHLREKIFSLDRSIFFQEILEMGKLY